MKAVIHALVEIGLIDFMVFLQRLFIGGPAFINAAIESGVMQQQRRFNFIDLLQRRLAAVNGTAQASSGIATAAALLTPPP